MHPTPHPRSAHLLRSLRHHCPTLCLPPCFTLLFPTAVTLAAQGAARCPISCHFNPHSSPPLPSHLLPQEPLTANAMPCHLISYPSHVPSPSIHPSIYPSPSISIYLHLPSFISIHLTSLCSLLCHWSTHLTSLPPCLRTFCLRSRSPSRARSASPDRGDR